jgi:hypothetical protein
LIALEDQPGTVPLEAERGTVRGDARPVLAGGERLRGGPLLVAVDDLHWADRASLRFVSTWPTGWPGCRWRWRFLAGGRDRNGASRLAALRQIAADGVVS